MADVGILCRCANLKRLLALVTEGCLLLVPAVGLFFGFTFAFGLASGFALTAVGFFSRQLPGGVYPLFFGLRLAYGSSSGRLAPSGVFFEAADFAGGFSGMLFGLGPLGSLRFGALTVRICALGSANGLLVTAKDPFLGGGYTNRPSSGVG